MSPSSADRLRNLRDSKEIAKTYSLYGQARLPNYLQTHGTFVWGSGHDANMKPNVDLSTSQTNETEVPGGIGALGYWEHMAFRDDGPP